MEKKDIGIKKKRVISSVLLWVLFIGFTLICLMMWWEYASQDHYKYLNENAIEVEATITKYHTHYYGDKGERFNVLTYYEYESEWGTVYRGQLGTYSSVAVAKSHIGDKEKIFIDPNSNWSARFLPSVDYQRALRDAIIWCCPIPIVLYLWLYRCIYRNVLNKKICKKFYGKCYKNDRMIFDPPADMIITGEVTKVWKWIVCYVKVKYQDENGVEREKWARSWFTHKEAKFLKQKKYINIIPYKNTYGILEEMPTK